MWTWPTEGISFGGDYNPEQWPEHVQDEDARLMQEAGVNFVSVGIFSWGLLEPTAGEFDFGWLDRVLDRMHAAGVRVDLATATASPPTWMSRLHPETLPVDRDGRRLWHGSRQTFCPSSPVIAELLAATRRADGDALRRPPGPGDVARRQRARQPQRPLLLRRQRGRPSASGCRRGTARAPPDWPA